jgi:hypothetical protein
MNLKAVGVQTRIYIYFQVWDGLITMLPYRHDGSEPPQLKRTDWSSYVRTQPGLRKVSMSIQYSEASIMILLSLYFNKITLVLFDSTEQRPEFWTNAIFGPIRSSLNLQLLLLYSVSDIPWAGIMIATELLYEYSSHVLCKGVRET